ncbi:mRNA cap guanine-N7 methyltransferase [Drosophila grimshawi]|uniref:mRNA cap guanine-N(7) methyltransferase n=1 Tax=Drosophila grimshawi TaxID=7222 RepID=B4JAW7_DROGR|nr:mRNA cap guanine-N7 methyltransferase [Drosophila grimshawi]EDW02837.1 GH10912 [Drosophila grimshawi]
MSIQFETNSADEDYARAKLSDDEESEDNVTRKRDQSLAANVQPDRDAEADAEADAEPEGSGAANTHVVAHHYNELKEAGRRERHKSKIYFMRNFNNWIKSQLINEYMALIKNQKRVGDALRVLDMCCGKGGDLLKWDKALISHLICTDIADVSVEQCQRRYQDILQRAEKSKYGHKFTAEFFACDSTMVRLRERYKDASLQLNLVSCQFAFHYCFESLSQADCMMRNAAECLEPGGYFIATIPDAYEIMRRLKAAGPDARRFGNDVYSIEFEDDMMTEAPPLFGAKYQFHLEGVVDCPEFLVHFPTLVKLGRKHGLQLIRRSTFADYYKETMPQGRQLLQRMSGLESVQANRCANDEQFKHVAKAFGAQRGRPLGTLSKSEWEATTLYLVCAFKKCKNSWDANGKPIFEFND